MEQNKEIGVIENLEKALALYNQIPEILQNSIKSHQQVKGEYLWQEWNEYLSLFRQINQHRKEAFKVQIQKPKEPRKPLNPISEGLVTAFLISVVLAILSWLANFSFVLSLPVALVAGIIAFFVRNASYYKDKKEYASLLESYNEEFLIYEKIDKLKEKVSQIPHLDIVELFLNPLLQVLKEDIQKDLPIRLFLNFQRHKLSSQKRNIKDNYKHPRLLRVQTDFWVYTLFEIKLRLQKKITLQIQIGDAYKQRQVSKQGASGKIKNTSKHKFVKQTSIQMTMAQEVFEEVKKAKASSNRPANVRIRIKGENGKKTIALKTKAIETSYFAIETAYTPNLDDVLKNLTYLFAI